MKRWGDNLEGETPTIIDGLSQKHRLVLLAVLLIIMTLSSLACAGKMGVQTTPPTLTERIARLKADEAERRASETPEERAIRARAEEIEREEAKERAVKARAKYDSPAMKQARKEAEKAIETKKTQHEALRNAQLVGCHPDTVWISTKADPPRVAFNSHVLVRVTNPGGPGGVPINVEDPQRGLVVRNLGPGCSLTLNWGRQVADSAYSTLRYIAKGQLPNGTLLMEEGPQLNLSKYDWQYGRGQQFLDWTVRLREVPMR